MKISPVTKTIICTAALVTGLTPAGRGQNSPAGPETLLGLDKVCEIHLVVKPEEWAKLQPPEGTDWNIYRAFEKMGRDAEAGRHFHSDESSRPGLAGYIGVDHQYGKADVTIDGETIQEVGLRYKGNGTFLQGREHEKYSFKIDFNEFVDDQEFRGLTKINLQNNISDASYLREALSYELFREAGIPCSRVGWARVKLTVTGTFENRDLGVYSLVEQVGKRFLKDRYGSSKGLLLKPSTFSAFRHLGLDWAEYEKAYFPKTKASDEQKEKLIDFTRLVHEATVAEFDQEIEQYLDTDQFLKFLAVNALLSNLDSFLGGTQNYYAYLEPESEKFQFLPWDLDHSFGSFELVGTPESRRNLSIDTPHWGSNEVIERMLVISRYEKAYHGHLQRFLDTIFAEEKLRNQIATTAAFVRPLVQEASSGSSAVKRFDAIVAKEPDGREPHALNLFVSERRASITRQLSGSSQGQELEMGKLPDFEKLAPAGIAVFVAVILNFITLIWAAIAGFKGSVLWGLLNVLCYPLTPIIYGFGIRRDLGRGAAIATIVNVGIASVTVGFLIWTLNTL